MWKGDENKEEGDRESKEEGIEKVRRRGWQARSLEAAMAREEERQSEGGAKKIGREENEK